MTREAPFPAYTGDQPYIFVSYAHEDAARVYPELQWLHSRGVNLWYDEGISPGSEWREELGRAVRQSRCLLFFVSPDSVLSPHCRREVNDALDLGVDCLTVHLQKTELPDGLRLSLSGLQAILKYKHTGADFRARLLAALDADPGSVTDFGVPAASVKSNAGRWWVWGVAALVLITLIAVVSQTFVGVTKGRHSSSFVDVSNPVPGFSNRAAIAVMPFINLSEDNVQDYFADGLTQDLITGLQSFQSFPVIASTSTFQYKNTRTDARTIAEDLGAGYIIEGSVRRVGDQVRINVQLNNRVGKLLWADKLDFEYKDVLRIQDDLIQRVLFAIEPKLIVSEADRARYVRSEDMQAWDYYLQALPNTLAPWSFSNLNGQTVSKAQGELARSLLLKALEIDPQFASAYRLLNHVESWNAYALYEVGENAQGTAALQRAISYGKQARQLSPFEPSLCSCLAADMLVVGDVESALGLQIEAKQQNPSNANVRGILAKILQVKGEYRRALEEIAMAKRLSPKGMSMSYFLTWEASIHQSMGNFKLAVATAESAMLLSPVNNGAQYIKIISSLALGNEAVADAAVQALRNSTPQGIRVLVLFADVFPLSVADKITLADGTSFAGMSYMQGLDAILAQFGWIIDRS